MSTRVSGGKRQRRSWRLDPRKQPVQRRSQATVEHILSAAAQVFETHGYARGTTNRIAERAGVSVGTLYQYFPSKEAVAVALLEGHIRETNRKLHEWVGHMVSRRHGLRDAMQDYIRGVMEVHETRPRLQHMLLEETPLPERLHEVLARAEHEAIEAMAGWLRLFPGVRRDALDRAGYLVIHTVESLTHRFAAHPEERILDKDDFVAELVAMLEAYLTDREAGAGPSRTPSRASPDVLIGHRTRRA
jgi:AcrR family transcriptional regulator